MGDAPKLKPLKVVEIFDASFKLYRDNFVTFLGILAAAYVPIAILNVIMAGTLYGALATHAPRLGDHPDLGQILSALIPFILVGFVTGILSMIALSLATGALTRAVGNRYLNEPTSIGSCYRHIFGIFMKYLGTNLLFGLVVVLGMILLIVPGLIFVIMFIFTSSIVVLEGLGGTAALGRSRQLARGNWSRIIGMAILMGIINIVLNKGAEYLLGMVVPKTLDPIPLMMVYQGFGHVIAMILSPLFSVAWILLYYDIRIRNEAFDLEVLARNMGGSSAPGPGAPAPSPSP